MHTHPFLTVAAGVVAGLGIFSTVFYAWMIWGADPSL